jgi:hypothetical protein
MSAVMAEPYGNWAEPSFSAQLASTSAAVADLAEAAGGLADVADEEIGGVMSDLTTLVGRLDALRVEVTRQVRQRGLYRLRGARDVRGWLRADARTADEAWKLSRLAAMAPELPRITGLLAEGSVSLAQAGTACWQVSQLPDVPVRPEEAPPPADPPPADPATAEDGPGDEPGAEAGPDDEPTAGAGDEHGDELWAGLWRGGDVHAAADQLFAQFMPGMDGQQLRELGAHLRDAADAQERAGEDYDDFTRRALRISRSLGGAAEVSGRLHPEAAEQVIAAFEELGALAGPDDKRTKAQRWADVLTRLAALAGLAAPDAHPPTDRAGQPAQPTADGGAGQSDASGQADGKGQDRNRGDPGPAETGAAETGAAETDDDQPGPAETGAAETGAAETGTAETGAAETDDDQPGPAEGHDHDLTSRNREELAASDHTPGRHDHEGSAADGRQSGAAPTGLRRPRVIVTVPISTLLGWPLAPGAVLGAGTPITAETARRLSCDAEIIRMITGSPPDTPAGTSGYPGMNATDQLTALLGTAIAQLPRPLSGPSAVLDIGRKSPGWTPRQRDALYAQYGGRCGRPGCNHPIDVVHHIIHWILGGLTCIINGLPLCLYDHWLVHEGGWRVTKDRGGDVSFLPPPPGWRPGTIYRRGKPVTETATGTADQ